jgi:hypothetical protein
MRGVVSQAEISHGLSYDRPHRITESPLSTRIYCALPIVPLTRGCRVADISPRVLEVVQHPAPNTERLVNKTATVILHPK